MSATPGDPVLIIGGGISGLCLAQGLKKLHIPFKVFERDAETAARAQGYRVRLHDGVDIIQDMVPSSVSALFNATTAVLEHGMQQYNAITGSIYPLKASRAPRGARRLLAKPGESGGSHAAATLDRRVLRDVLLTGIGEDVVFGKMYSHFEIDEDRANVMAYFTDGSSERGRLLVGADGKWSAVRRQHVPDFVMLDTGHGGYFGKTPLTAEFREIFERNTDLQGIVLVRDMQTLATPIHVVMEKMAWSPTSRNNVSTVQLPQDYIYWVLLVERASTPFSEEELAGPLRWGDGAVQAILDLTKSWTPELRKVLTGQTPQETAFIPVHSASPKMLAWKPSRYVTLVGDAVHGMPPFAALGANTALRGVHLLYQAIEQHGMEGLTEDIIGRYEAELRGLAVETIEQSFEAGQFTFKLKSPKEYRVLKARGDKAKL
ncbi:hypothetical protein PG993_003572 [Apiospora rasikravindrae]|uniref:FAD-binding domain-containing protein n=1 Tax=Apiospora rasikravindrae TaxID=990691 RepID=A0ABR1TZZ2_9PEZI